MPTRTYDAIVIGSGPAGSFAVKELTERGLEVLLLEAGPNISEGDFRPPKQSKSKGIDVWPRVKAGIKGQHVQARVAFFGEQFTRLFVNDREHPYTTPRDAFFLWIRGRQLGGRLHTYGRMLLRMTDYDFKAASRDGHGEDWPISYAELAPYYDRVEECMGVYGDEEHIPNLPDGHFCKHPKLTTAEKAFRDHVQSRWPDRRVISWRYAAPNLKRVPLPILAAERTGRLTIRTDAIVKRITVDSASGRATGAEIIDRLTRKSGTVSANMVVLCASTIESVRILLNSGCTKHPDGLGNSSRLLGHYFMDQCPSLTFGKVPAIKGWELDDSAPLDAFYPPSGGIYVPRFQNLDTTTHPGFKRGFAFQGAIGRHFVPEGQPAQFGIMGFGETLPYYENFIALSSTRKDAWGVPSPHITCRLGANEKALLTEQLKSVTEIVSECGYKVDFGGSAFGLQNPREAFRDAGLLSRWMFRISFARSMAVGAAIHECGGARMGTDPSKSVLNSFNQSWDVKNLFVTDGSSFPSSGTVGPALTIMAVSARACEYAAQEYKAGRL
jgi:choline dehydrogenase-like flavoprotein